MFRPARPRAIESNRPAIALAASGARKTHQSGKPIGPLAATKCSLTSWKRPKLGARSRGFTSRRQELLENASVGNHTVINPPDTMHLNLQLHALRDHQPLTTHRAI